MKVPEPRKLKSGTWFIQLRLNGVSVPVTGATKTECHDAAALIKAEYRAGKREIKERGGQPTLRQAIDAYIERRENTLSPSTITGYRRIQAGRFKCIMDKPIDQINDWQAVCDSESKICSPKTLKNAFHFCCSVLKENGSATPKVTLPTMIPHEREWLEPDQIKALVSSVKGTNEELTVLFGLHGLRRSEILGMEWKNIDLKNRRFRVSGAVVKDVTGHYVMKPANKNATSTRTLPFMVPALYDALSAIPEEDRTGTVIKINGNSILYQVNKACRMANVPEVGTHGLRHSFASLAYHLGLSEMETMQLGGWADNQTMRKIYTHLASADRLKAENKIAAFFKNAN
ncbi:MAG: site-specific integrase [Oscillospiraceae bacterium]|nr:site-specific integrase [Oscillospiraceae bacterium]